MEARQSAVAKSAAAAAAALLVSLTLVRFGLTANGIGWAVVQVVFVTLALIDLQERRIPNRIVLPLIAAGIATRLAFVRGSVAEVVVATLIAFAVFLGLHVVTRGGLGMGDVKLAAAVGALLGSSAMDALLLGVALGGVAALVLVITRRAGRQSTYAYGPYLALGAAIAILVSRPPPLL